MNKTEFIETYGNPEGFNYDEFESDLNQVIASEIERVMPDEKAIYKEGNDSEMPKDENGYNTFKYAFDDDQLDAFVSGANWLKSEITRKLNLKEE